MRPFAGSPCRAPLFDDGDEDSNYFPKAMVWTREGFDYAMLADGAATLGEPARLTFGLDCGALAREFPGIGPRRCAREACIINKRPDLAMLIPVEDGPGFTDNVWWVTDRPFRGEEGCETLAWGPGLADGCPRGGSEDED